jgi:hypothetical protein
MATLGELRQRIADWEREHGYRAERVFDVFSRQRSQLAECFPDLDLAAVVEGATRWAEYQEQLREETGTDDASAQPTTRDHESR